MRKSSDRNVTRRSRLSIAEGPDNNTLGHPTLVFLQMALLRYYYTGSSARKRAQFSRKLMNNTQKVKIARRSAEAAAKRVTGKKTNEGRKPFRLLSSRVMASSQKWLQARGGALARAQVGFRLDLGAGRQVVVIRDVQYPQNNGDEADEFLLQLLLDEQYRTLKEVEQPTTTEIR